MGAVVIAILSTAALLGAIGYVATQQQKKRTLAMQGAAERLGWRFSPTADLGVIPGMDRLELFSQGHSRQIRNFTAGHRDGREIAVFDYKYVTGGGKSTQVWRQTVVHVHSPGMRYPRFALRPEHVFHKIGGLFGYQDIDLPAYPDFSKRYLLRGQDEAAIRALFDSGVVDFYDRNPRCCTEADGARLFFWRTGKFAAAEDVPALIDQALALVSRFADGPAAAPGSRAG